MKLGWARALSVRSAAASPAMRIWTRRSWSATRAPNVCRRRRRLCRTLSLRSRCGPWLPRCRSRLGSGRVRRWPGIWRSGQPSIERRRIGSWSRLDGYGPSCGRSVLIGALRLVRLLRSVSGLSTGDEKSISHERAFAVRHQPWSSADTSPRLRRQRLCEWGDTVPVRVRIPADLSCSGRSHWKRARIDRCIAPLVRALQEGGVDMRGSCCGHGRGEGHIDLQDGRLLRILEPDKAAAWLAGLKAPRASSERRS
jgi:hypothetical protein